MVGEIRKNRRGDKIKALVIGEIAKIYGVTPDHVRACMRGVYNGGIADDVRKEYPLMYERIKNAIHAG